MSTDPIYKNFWSWFTKNSNELWNFEKSQEGVLDKIQSELGKIHESLTFEIGPIKVGRRDLVISADGIRGAFHHVEKLVMIAPQITVWNFIAFRPRCDPNIKINLGQLSIDSTAVYYELETNGKLIGINIFFDCDNAIEEKELRTIGYLFLDNTIGEHDMETKVGPIDMQLLPRGRDISQLNSIIELPNEFDRLWSRIQD